MNSLDAGAKTATTRRAAEVQDASAERFAAKLRDVFGECHRVLKDDGLLVFSYHHSREEGWQALANALLGAGFNVVNSHPVKAEMSVATPKSQAKEPIQLDIVLVCRKQGFSHSQPNASTQELFSRARDKLFRLAEEGFSLSRNDRKIVYFGQFLTAISAPSDMLSIAERISLELKCPLEPRHVHFNDIQQKLMF
jgi:putative DNA methylase